MNYVLIIYAVLVGVVGCDTIAKAGQVAIPQHKVISKLISKHATKYNVEREILSCVLKVESNYRMGIISETEDYGMAQVNIRNVRAYNLDTDKLLTDVNYNIEFAAQLLSEYRHSFKSSEINNWVARYNIGHQSLSAPNVGALYVHYNAKVQACIHSNDYL